MSLPKILVVDDEEVMRDVLGSVLGGEGYSVRFAATGPDAIAELKESPVDAVILDLMLPGMSGYEVLEQLRANEATRDVAVLMLTARREEADRIQGLSLGADDYLTKPFSPQELVLRVRNILRRTRTKAAERRNVVHIGAVEIDRDAHTVTLDGKQIDLTATEYKLLMTLADRRGRVQSRAQLLEIVWESAPDIQTRTVDMHVQRLRAKLGSAGEAIETVRGFGYRLRRSVASDR